MTCPSPCVAAGLLPIAPHGAAACAVNRDRQLRRPPSLPRDRRLGRLRGPDRFRAVPAGCRFPLSVIRRSEVGEVCRTCTAEPAGDETDAFDADVGAGGNAGLGHQPYGSGRTEGEDAPAVLVGGDEVATEPAERGWGDGYAPFDAWRVSCHHCTAAEAVDRVESGLAGDDRCDEEAIAEPADNVEGDTGREGVGGEVDESHCLSGRDDPDDARRRVGIECEDIVSLEGASSVPASAAPGARAMYGSPPAATYPAGPRANSVAAPPGRASRRPPRVESTSCPSARGPTTSTSVGTCNKGRQRSSGGAANPVTASTEATSRTLPVAPMRRPPRMAAR